MWGLMDQPTDPRRSSLPPPLVLGGRIEVGGWSGWHAIVAQAIRVAESPHPNPPPEYQGRGKKLHSHDLSDPKRVGRFPLVAWLTAVLLLCAGGANVLANVPGGGRLLPDLIPPPAGSADASGDPIGPIAEQMKDVVGDLSALKTDAPVQTKQKNVVVALDTVIKELEQQCKGSGGGSNPNPTKPMNRSILAKGPGGSGPLHDAAAGTRVWGQLPPKERDQILQSKTEGFPAGYESVLANYYSRLAQEQVAPDAGTDQPTTRPAGP